MNQIQQTRHWNPHYTKNFKTDRPEDRTVSWTDLMPIVGLGWRLGEWPHQTRRRCFRHYTIITKAPKPRKSQRSLFPSPRFRDSTVLETPQEFSFYLFLWKFHGERKQLAALVCLRNRGSSLKGGVMIASRFFPTATWDRWSWADRRARWQLQRLVFSFL